MTFKIVLIAVDTSAIAAHAADVGIELARSLKADVALVHVIDQALLAGTESALPGQELIAVLEQDAKTLLAKFRSKSTQQPRALEFIKTGPPATEILNVARKWQADVIVMGTHGQGGVARLLVGSVAEEVLRHATCPVLVARL